MRLNVYLAKINKEDMTAREDELVRKVSPWRREKILKMKNPSVRAESLAAGLVLGYALEHELTEKLNTEVTFEYDIEEGVQGKPFIKNLRCFDKSSGAALDAPAPEFNISHSGKYVAAVVGKGPLGLDVETKSDKDLKVTKRMFSEPEKERIIGAEDPDSEFRTVWTEKEAYLKCTGEGISVSLKSFYKNEDTAEVMRDNSGEFAGTGYYVYTVKPGEDTLSLAVCSKDKNITLDIINVIDL